MNELVVEYLGEILAALIYHVSSSFDILCKIENAVACNDLMLCYVLLNKGAFTFTLITVDKISILL